MGNGSLDQNPFLWCYDNSRLIIKSDEKCIIISKLIKWNLGIAFSTRDLWIVSLSLITFCMKLKHNNINVLCNVMCCETVVCLIKIWMSTNSQQTCLVNGGIGNLDPRTNYFRLKSLQVPLVHYTYKYII